MSKYTMSEARNPGPDLLGGYIGSTFKGIQGYRGSGSISRSRKRAVRLKVLPIKPAVDVVKRKR